MEVSLKPQKGIPKYRWPSLVTSRLVKSQGLFENKISGDWIYSKSLNILNRVALTIHL